MPSDGRRSSDWNRDSGNRDACAWLPVTRTTPRPSTIGEHDCWQKTTNSSPSLVAPLGIFYPKREFPWEMDSLALADALVADVVAGNRWCMRRELL